MIKIEVYGPEGAVGPLREAMNEASGCRLGSYDNCIAVTRMQGYWRPLEGANPHEGEVGKLCSAPECKIETFATKEKVNEVVAAIRRVHPYEEPVIHLIPLL